MPRSKRATTPSNLELFILYAIRELGLWHATLLQREAGVSLGAAVPALRRLEEKHLVVSREEGARTIGYSLTPAGQAVLESTLEYVRTYLSRLVKRADDADAVTVPNGRYGPMDFPADVNALQRVVFLARRLGSEARVG